MNQMRDGRQRDREGKVKLMRVAASAALAPLVPVLCFVALGFVALCVLFPARASAADFVEGCLQHEEHEFLTFFLVDRTDKLDDTQNLKQSFASLKESLRPGERLLVGVIGAKGGDARVVMDMVRPAKSIWDSALKIRAKEKVFSDCFAKMQDALLQPTEEKKTSAILETLSFVASSLTSDQAKSKRVLVFSDMVQNSAAVSFYGPKAPDPDVAMKTVEKGSLVFPFGGAEVYVAGAGGKLLSDEKARTIEQFWRKYFEKSGGALKSYGPVFLGFQG